MNAPTKPISLDDKYLLEEDNIFLTGTQALVRLALIQRRRDIAAGLNTAGFISGYRGSPMTVVDNELWRAKSLLEEDHIHFWPGVNENLAMTSVWGSQQVGFFGDAKYDGVFGLWYGKGPGLDQTIDGLRKANENGTTKNGGVLVMVGDDPYQRSTYDAYYSDLLFEDLWMPVLYPSDIQDVLDMGLLGIAMSRFTGSYIGYKLLPETIETASSILSDHNRIQITLPEFEFPADGVNARHPDGIYGHEERIVRYKIPAAIAFARANKINKITHDSMKPRIGIAAAGMTWRIVLQALRDLGITDDKAEELGIRVLKIGMPFPIDEETYREFADGLEEVLIIDDKREQTENAFRKICFDLPGARRPRIIGRDDENGDILVRNYGELTADDISRVIAKRIGQFHQEQSIEARISKLDAAMIAQQALAPVDLARLPYFCPGCPHNSSTKTPEGSKSFGGVGCHWMATWMERDVELYTHMGAEGSQWIGQAPFVTTEHTFQNVGDGTYFHSGSLNLRAAVSAGVNITFKVLFNDAVAMTGGQPVDGVLTVPQIAHQARAETIERIVVVSDEPEKFSDKSIFPSGVTFHHRLELDQVQHELREIKGVSVLIYDQTCAAEKRRRRKRGLFPDPPKRLFINDRVCEGCGDCGKASNCLAVEPVETEYGRKRKINQSTCNKDFSCQEGFCPSFVTVKGGSLKKGAGLENQSSDLRIELPEPKLPEISKGGDFGILITGVGGTGVITIGALLGMAAHIDGIGVSIVDQMGFAQKGGPVMTHVRLAEKSDQIHSVRINAGHADTVIGCDILVTGGDQVMSAIDPETSTVVLNTHEAITGEFTRNTTQSFPSARVIKRLSSLLGDERLKRLNANSIATGLLGDSIASNLFLVGYAWQLGLVPLTQAAILQAVELNGVAVEWNKQAFLWGRRMAHDPDAVEKLLWGDREADDTPKSLDEMITGFASELEAYQNDEYAAQYRDFVERIRTKELEIAPQNLAMTKAVVVNAFKLMAYKDEYEVGRLFSDPEFKRKLDEQFEGDYKIEFNLSPPLLAPKHPSTGLPRKIALGRWMLPAFKLLSKMKGLRGTSLDIFGYSAERKMERQLIAEYKSIMGELVAGLTSENYSIAVKIAALPDMVRGYGHVKDKNVVEYQVELQSLLERFHAQKPRENAA